MRTTIWIGDIQWRLRNGVRTKQKPILRKLDAIECRDALLSEVKDGEAGALVVAEYVEANWPAADFIVGNPPFLGNKAMISTLGQEYTERLRSTYSDRLGNGVDLVCYWFERACNEMAAGQTASVSMVTTQSIRNQVSKGKQKPLVQSGSKETRRRGMN